MFGRVALFGTLAVVTAITLAVIGLYAGLGYEPPWLSTERVAGTWSDGKGGTLILTADGKATATRIETFDFDESFESVVEKCTGAGTGPPEHPKLFVYVGDPDSSDLYILQRRD